MRIHDVECFAVYDGGSLLFREHEDVVAFELTPGLRAAIPLFSGTPGSTADESDRGVVQLYYRDHSWGDHWLPLEEGALIMRGEMGQVDVGVMRTQKASELPIATFVLWQKYDKDAVSSRGKAPFRNEIVEVETTGGVDTITYAAWDGIHLDVDGWDWAAVQVRGDSTVGGGNDGMLAFEGVKTGNNAGLHPAFLWSKRMIFNSNWLHASSFVMPIRGADRMSMRARRHVAGVDTRAIVSVKLGRGEMPGPYLYRIPIQFGAIAAGIQEYQGCVPNLGWSDVVARFSAVGQPQTFRLEAMYLTDVRGQDPGVENAISLAVGAGASGSQYTPLRARAGGAFTAVATAFSGADCFAWSMQNTGGAGSTRATGVCQLIQHG